LAYFLLLRTCYNEIIVIIIIIIAAAVAANTTKYFFSFVDTGLLVPALEPPYLTFESQAVSLRTTGFNIQKFYMVLALLCVLYGSQNRQRLFFTHN
jgi:hypothetical protein